MATVSTESVTVLGEIYSALKYNLFPIASIFPLKMLEAQ
jgi:hypothetical protein